MLPSYKLTDLKHAKHEIINERIDLSQLLKLDKCTEPQRRIKGEMVQHDKG